MNRAHIALFAIPLVISVFFGVGAFIVAPIMLIITVLIAVPLLSFCSWKEWLNWWQVAIVGLGCGVLFTALFAFATNGTWVDRSGLKSALFYSALGLINSLLFWWIGVFRNSAFPFISPKFPYSMLLVIPVFTFGYYLYNSLHYEHITGRIISITGSAPTRSALVRLSSGSVVNASFHGDDRPNSVLLNQCWHLSYHWSTKRFSSVYSFDSPMGSNTNEC